MTGPVGFDVKVREWSSLLRFWGCCISAHQSQALGAETEHPAGCSHTAHLLGQGEQTKSTAIDDVIIGHRWRLLWGGEVPTEWRRRVLRGRASRCRVYSERGQARPPSPG